MTGIFGTAAGYHTLIKCDTLLLLGCDFAWRQFYPEHARIVQIDIDPTHIGRRHPVEIGVVGDVKATLEALPGGQKMFDRRTSPAFLVSRPRTLEGESRSGPVQQRSREAMQH